MSRGLWSLDIRVAGPGPPARQRGSLVVSYLNIRLLSIVTRFRNSKLPWAICVRYDATQLAFPSNTCANVPNHARGLLRSSELAPDHHIIGPDHVLRNLNDAASDPFAVSALYEYLPEIRSVGNIGDIHA